MGNVPQCLAVFGFSTVLQSIIGIFYLPFLLLSGAWTYSSAGAPSEFVPYSSDVIGAVSSFPGVYLFQCLFNPDFNTEGDDQVDTGIRQLDFLRGKTVGAEDTDGNTSNKVFRAGVSGNTLPDGLLVDDSEKN